MCWECAGNVLCFMLLIFIKYLWVAHFLLRQDTAKQSEKRIFSLKNLIKAHVLRSVTWVGHGNKEPYKRGVCR